MTVEEAIAELKDWRKTAINHGSYYGEKAVDVYDMAISALEPQRWIPVTERLPEDDAIVIVYKPLAKGTTIEMQITQGWCINPVIMSHWMPLPEPPKEEDDENTVD